MNKTVHMMKLQPEPFDAIRSGDKIIESRLYDEKRRSIKIGDIVEFQKNPKLDEKLSAEVVALLNYPTFERLMSDFPPQYFGLETKDALLEQIHQFYTREDEQKYTVLGIKVRII